ncbi:MAG: gliding motility-associated C-terminal domain-containing protein, partial [Flavobacteriales bacterium]|nr:gliding motility-associated C-terminal domain-containing protein [Flavobacteriales bacterium]
NCDEPDIFVPNAFTPNGDGSNDLLFVRGRFITELDFQVFDRWGEKVFETSDQNVGWDGTFRGKPVDPAVFVYHLTVRCEDGQRYFKKGNVTVIR